MLVHSDYKLLHMSDAPRALGLGTSLAGHGDQRRSKDRGQRRPDLHQKFIATDIDGDLSPDPKATLASTLASLDPAPRRDASVSRRRVTAAYADDD